MASVFIYLNFLRTFHPWRQLYLSLCFPVSSSASPCCTVHAWTSPFIAYGECVWELVGEIWARTDTQHFFFIAKQIYWRGLNKSGQNQWGLKRTVLLLFEDSSHYVSWYMIHDIKSLLSYFLLGCSSCVLVPQTVKRNAVTWKRRVETELLFKEMQAKVTLRWSIMPTIRPALYHSELLYYKWSHLFKSHNASQCLH